MLRLKTATRKDTFRELCTVQSPISALTIILTDKVCFCCLVFKKAHVSFQRKSKIDRHLDFGSADRTVDLAPFIDFRDVKHAHFVVTSLSSSRNRRPFKTFRSETLQASSSCLKRSFRLHQLKGASKRTKPKNHGAVVDKKPLWYRTVRNPIIYERGSGRFS